VFERFTDRARRVVVLAQEEARMLDHNYIGTEHLLLGLIHEREGVAAKALESLGISLKDAREQVEEILGHGRATPSGHIAFTPRARKVLELSLREALALNHNYIGTEHILLGLIREGEGVAAQVLHRLGADLHRARQQVIQLLSGYSGSEAGVGVVPGAVGGGLTNLAIPILEHLTDAALAGLVAARAEARRLDLDTVEVSALLVGLLTIMDGAAVKELTEVAELLDQLRSALGEPVGSSTSAPAGEAVPPPLSEGARRVVARAAMNSGGGAIGTGHLIAALVAEDAIAGLLRAVGLDVSAVRERAARLQGETGLP
jgi:ATP-dependent Clp protease ATP-binding subunit ClpA